MPDYQEYPLWRCTLGSVPSSKSELSAIELLRSNYENLRKRVEVIASTIRSDLPSYTIHDISHCDRLWYYAGIIGGDELSINPLEAFILGASFLIHDLGMALCAYPGGKTYLEKTDAYLDSLSRLMIKHLGKIPTQDELEHPPSEIKDQSLRAALRILHAEHAEELLKQTWQINNAAGTLETVYLLDNSELRTFFGSLIGIIAKSHGDSVDKLISVFDPTTMLGCPGILPDDWRIRSLFVACLLRVSDAAHIDATRAPLFAEALIPPEESSKPYWRFQQYMSPPVVRNERLIYSSAGEFTLEEMEAWWCGYDTLQMIDKELRDVDSLLSSLGWDQFAAQSVAHIESPGELKKHGFGTKNWEPVDTRVRVSNVAALVERLGGSQLYGEDPTVPLRELIQNAADAIRAKRVLKNEPLYGEIVVKFGQENENTFWIEVEDNGIGMSSTVLTNEFLDFGISFWGTEHMNREFPGLSKKGFESTGKFGIGFYSVFMWSSHVKVCTRRYGIETEPTRVLEFVSGTKSRPLLRNAMVEEKIPDSGTKVRVYLASNPITNEGALKEKDVSGVNKMLARLCPTLDVDLSVYADGQKVNIIKANDWLQISPLEIQRRSTTRWFLGSKHLEHITDIKKNGTTLGRLAATLSPYGSSITVGGLKSCAHDDVLGVILGKTKDASRRTATPLIYPFDDENWAKEQLRLISELYNPWKQMEYALLFFAHGVFPRNLVIMESNTDNYTYGSICMDNNIPDEFLLFTSVYDLRELRDYSELNKVDLSNVFVTFSEENVRGPLFNMILDSLSIKWHTTANEILKTSELDLYFHIYEQFARTPTEISVRMMHLIRRPLVK